MLFVVVAVVGVVGGRDPPILYITTPDRPPLRLLCYDSNIISAERIMSKVDSEKIIPQVVIHLCAVRDFAE